MKMKMMFVLALVLAMATAGYAQTGLAGKWVTDPPAAPAAAPAAPPAAGAPAGGPGGGGGRGGGGRGGGAGAQTRLDFTVDGAKLTGTMFEGGADLEIKEGTVSGKQAKWYTIRPLNGQDFRVNWTADLTDDNTITLNREFPNGVPGRGGAAPPGGAPRGGVPPAAAGAAPAGGAPAGGAPGGGGGGGGRGGGGRGGGAIAAVILHRAK